MLKFSTGPRKGFNHGSLEDIDSHKEFFSGKILAQIVFSLPYHPSSSQLFQGAYYPFDYPFETDNFCMYSLMGKTEPDFQYSYSLRYQTNTGQFKLIFVSYLKELSGFLYIRIRPDYPYSFDLQQWLMLTFLFMRKFLSQKYKLIGWYLGV